MFMKRPKAFNHAPEVRVPDKKEIKWEDYLMFTKGFEAGLKHKSSLSYFDNIKRTIKDICNRMVHGN